MESGMGSREVRHNRYINDDDGKRCWDWLSYRATEIDKKKLLGCCIEIATRFFFSNFVYTFGGENYVQAFGGPIGARLTMCLARLVMQAWSEEFSSIPKKCDIKEHLRAIYVDDGRNAMDKVGLGYRFNKESQRLVYQESWKEEDIDNGVTGKERTVAELSEIMNSINPDLKFTTEVEEDFPTRRLPTLSFEIWSNERGIVHSYYEKPMRSQFLTMSRSSQAERNKFSILVNEMARRFEVMDSQVDIEETTACQFGVWL